MIKQFLTILFFIIALSTHAQLKVSTVSLNRNGSWLNYEFPFVTGVNTKAANAINHYLQKQVLENDTATTDTTKIFEKVRYRNTSNEFHSGYSFLGYKILLNSKTVLSIEINIEGTGAYSEYYNQYYNFDVKTGKPITLTSIFSTKGIKLLEKEVKAIRKKLIQSSMTELRSQENFVEDSAVITETFLQCNQQADLNIFSIQKDKITFRKEYCFPHAMRPYDTDLDVSFSIKKLQGYLSERGKQLLK